MTANPTDSLAPATKANTEIELKLRASPGAFERLKRASVFAQFAPQSATVQALDADYYDTPDLKLHRQGASFRVRRENDGYVQTLKKKGSSLGALKRGEWNTPVPEFRPFPEWIGVPGIRELTAPDADGTGGLTRIFSTRIQREARIVSHAGAVIEIAFDSGTIEVNGRSVAIAEVELELLKGAPSGLYALALELNAATPLHVELRSKPDRAYAQVTGEAPSWVKARKLAFAPGISVDGAISQVFRDCFGHWLANEPAALAGNDPEGVHQMRVALRRLRAGLTIFGDAIPVSQLDWLRSESKWLADSLGDARDWDVFFDELLDPLTAVRRDDASLAVLRRHCDRARDAGYDGVRAAIGSRRYTAFVLRLGEWLESAAWRRADEPDRMALLQIPLTDLADRLLSRRQRKVRKLGRGLATAPVERRHDLRLAIKKMRYSGEFFASLYRDKPARRFLKTASKLQDVLGKLNDVAVTEERVEALLAASPSQAEREAILRATGMVIGWTTEAAVRTEPQLLRLWNEYRKLPVFWNPVAPPPKPIAEPAFPAAASAMPALTYDGGVVPAAPAAADATPDAMPAAPGAAPVSVPASVPAPATPATASAPPVPGSPVGTRARPAATPTEPASVSQIAAPQPPAAAPKPVRREPYGLPARAQQVGAVPPRTAYETNEPRAADAASDDGDQDGAHTPDNGAAAAANRHRN